MTVAYATKNNSSQTKQKTYYISRRITNEAIANAHIDVVNHTKVDLAYDLAGKIAQLDDVHVSVRWVTTRAESGMTVTLVAIIEDDSEHDSNGHKPSLPQHVFAVKVLYNKYECGWVVESLHHSKRDAYIAMRKILVDDYNLNREAWLQDGRELSPRGHKYIRYFDDIRIRKLPIED